MSNNNGTKIAVALYVHGRDFDPEAATTLSGLEPTAAHARGYEWTTSTNKKVVAKEGLWSVRLERDGGSVDQAFNDLLNRVSSSASAVAHLPGVEDAYFDLFVTYQNDTSKTGESVIELSSGTLVRAASIGIPLRVTTAII
jgi:hypothetical protein